MHTKCFFPLASVLAFGWVLGCSGSKQHDEQNDTEVYVAPEHSQTGPPPSGADAQNTYSWDGSWSPAVSEFPLAQMFDETHLALPPGKWGWDGSCDCPGDEGLAIYNNEFVDKGLDFEALTDAQGNQFGWRLVATVEGAMSLNHRGDNYECTPYVDIVDLQEDGELAGTGPGADNDGINLGDGPDMLRYGYGHSVDMRMGSDTRGALFDNDLVILGTSNVAELNAYDIEGTTIHTGPGSDLVFARNFGPAAIDLGNGLAGRTDVLDSSDGDDIAVLAGNMRDFRVYGGYGDDVMVWYVDEVNDDRWLGPSFFGAGGWGDAIWSDDGTDRLILAIDPATEIVDARGLHDNNPGSLLSFVYSDYAPAADAPMEGNLYAQYYGSAPEGPNGERTVTLSYRSADASVFTHDFYITAIELLQLGTGDDAVVYAIDQANGALSVAADVAPMVSIPRREDFNALFDTFGRAQ